MPNAQAEMQRVTRFKGITPDGVHHFESRLVRAVRTEDEIQVQLEARLEELQKQAAARKLERPCMECRFADRSAPYGLTWDDPEDFIRFGKCANPLVKGFDRYGPYVKMVPKLCGPEKALWRPKLAFWQRLYNWFVDPFGWEKF